MGDQPWWERVLDVVVPVLATGLVLTFLFAPWSEDSVGCSVHIESEPTDTGDGNDR